MKRVPILVAVLAFLAPLASVHGETLVNQGMAANAARDAMPADGFVPLFNGRDLTGWKLNPAQPGNWRVENGILIGSDPVRSTQQRISPLYERIPFGSHLYTQRDDYSNFHLRIEARVSEGGNSGVFFRSEFEPVNNGFPTSPPGYEAELLAGDFGALVTPTDGLLAHGNTTLRTGDWVTLEVIAVNNRITSKINGETVVDFIDPQRRHKQGHIALQCWMRQSVVSFRKVEIKEFAIPADSLASATRHPMTSEEIDLYLKQQIPELELNRIVDNVSEQDTLRRKQVLRNLKALGPNANPAIASLAWVVANVKETDVASEASEVLGELDAAKAFAALRNEFMGNAFLQNHKAPPHPGEQALFKLLPRLGKSLTLEDAVALWDLYQRNSTRKKHYFPAIEAAWRASDVAPGAVAAAILRRARASIQVPASHKRYERPIPSPLNWQVLANCWVQPPLQGGVLNLERKPAWVLWAEENPDEAAERARRAALETAAAQDRLNRIPHSSGPTQGEIDREAQRRWQEDRDRMRRTE